MNSVRTEFAARAGGREVNQKTAPRWGNANPTGAQSTKGPLIYLAVTASSTGVTAAWSSSPVRIR